MTDHDREDRQEDPEFNSERTVRDLWNRREKKSTLPQYILLAVLCLILAYLLSDAVK